MADTVFTDFTIKRSGAGVTVIAKTADGKEQRFAGLDQVCLVRPVGDQGGVTAVRLGGTLGFASTNGRAA